MANEDEEQQLYLVVLKQPLDQFLQDLKTHQGKIKNEHSAALKAMLKDFYTNALDTLKQE